MVDLVVISFIYEKKILIGFIDIEFCGNCIVRIIVYIYLLVKINFLFSINLVKEIIMLLFGFEMFCDIEGV